MSEEKNGFKSDENVEIVFKQLESIRESVPMDPEKLKEDEYFLNIIRQPTPEVLSKTMINFNNLENEAMCRKAHLLTTQLKENYKKLSETKEYKRTHEINVRVNSEEKLRIEETAKKYGFKNVSDYIRFVTLNAKLFAGFSFEDLNSNK